MKEYIEQRCLEVAEYIIAHKATVRQTAKEYGISKSTVHKDCTERLRTIDKNLYQQVHLILAKNKEERHLRGGLATKRKYLHQEG